MFRPLSTKSDTLFCTNQPQVSFKKLHELDTEKNINYRRILEQAAYWTENHVGYMRQDEKHWNVKTDDLEKLRLERRKKLILARKDHFYMVIYASQLVGTFSLIPNMQNKTINLSYVYVHPNLRQHSIGTSILNEAKRIAAKDNLILTAHLLTSNVHGFYKKRGATFVTEDKALKEPCELIRIKAP